MRKLCLIILGLFFINLISAFPICIDTTAPSAPTNLEVTSSGTNIILNWDAAIDEPDCSGVDYYVVLRDGVIIGENINELTYTENNVPYGTYSYGVYAVDRVEHNSGPAIKNDVVLSAPNNGDGGNTRVSGGSGRDSYTCFEIWTCESWGECKDEVQSRTCTDSNTCGTEEMKPITTRGCEVEGAFGDEALSVSSLTIPQTNVFSRITGAVTGTLGVAGSWVVIVFLLLIAGSAITVRQVRKKKNVTSK